MKCSLGIPIFLKRSLVFPILFFSSIFFALIAEESFLISPCYSLELCIQTGISFLFSFAFHLSSFHTLLNQKLYFSNKVEQVMLALHKMKRSNRTIFKLPLALKYCYHHYVKWLDDVHASYQMFMLCVHACSVTAVVPDSLWPYGLQPSRCLCPWDSPGNNTGGGYYVLLQGIFLMQGSNPHLLYWAWKAANHQGSPSRWLFY